MAFTRDRTPSLLNTLFTSNSSQGNYRTESPLLHDPQKRPNTAPEIFGEKLTSFTETKFGIDRNLLHTNVVDDETRFLDRTVSPSFIGEFS